jgi:hypothetical protein
MYRLSRKASLYKQSVNLGNVNYASNPNCYVIDVSRTFMQISPAAVVTEQKRRVATSILGTRIKHKVSNERACLPFDQHGFTVTTHRPLDWLIGLVLGIAGD